MTTKILMVDDFPAILELYDLYFKSKCKTVEIEECTSALEGLEKMKSQQFDIIISDYDMRDMDGIEFLKTIRSKSDSTPFILLTGIQDTRLEIEALEYGAKFMQKGEEPKKHFDEVISMLREIKKHHAS